MANAKKVGTLIKKARTDAGLTLEQLAKKVTGASAGDISKAERGEKELTTDQLKQVAKATGVTQKSLLDAAKGTQTIKPASSSGSSSSSGSTMKLSAEEKKLVQLYRKADDDAKQKALKALGDEEESSGGSGLLGNLLGGDGGGSGIMDSLLGLLTGKRDMEGVELGDGMIELNDVTPDKNGK